MDSFLLTNCFPRGWQADKALDHRACESLDVSKTFPLLRRGCALLGVAVQDYCGDRVTMCLFFCPIDNMALRSADRL